MNQDKTTEHNKKIWLFSTFAILIGLCLAIVTAEITLRILGIGRPKPDQGPKQLYLPHEDPLIGYTLRPNYEDFVFGSWVEINPKGLRDQNYDYTKPANSKRIMVLGDSVTFGYGTTHESSFSEQWEEWLNQNAETNWQVINTGVPGWCTIQQAQWFKTEGKNYQPDAVIVCYVMNDPEPVHQLNEQGQLAPLEIDNFYKQVAETIPKPILPFTEQSNLLKFINRLLLHTHPDWIVVHDELAQYFNEDIFDLSSWPKAQQAMLEVQNYCAENDIFFHVAVYPTMYRLHSYEAHPFTRHYETVQETFNELGIPCIVPLDDFIGHSTNSMRAYEDDPHPGYASHRIFAQRLHQLNSEKWNDYDINQTWTD